MAIDQQRIDALVLSLTESLNVEVKGWIGTTTPEHQAKIVKACLALRNRNGGFLVVGFDDSSLQPDAIANKPDDVRTEFHTDKVQGLVSRFAQELFEVEVGFTTRDGIEYPVISVPAGVQVPVASKADLLSGADKLIRQGAVYFRTLNASGVPSTSIAHQRDWRDIVEICFDNREADIGRFVRRQLAGTDRLKLAEALTALGFITSAGPTGGAPQTTPAVDLRQIAEAWRNEGEQAFLAALAERNSATANAMAQGISWQVALIVSPAFPTTILDQHFLGRVLSSNPNYTGWPIWIDSRSSSDTESRPTRTDTSWTSFIEFDRSWGGTSLDFWMIEASRFYLWRTLQDDRSPNVQPGTVLDPMLMIYRVAEAMAVGLAFARVLGGDSATGTRVLGFAFKWEKLRNRRLTPWANPMVLMGSNGQSHVDNASSFVEVPLDTPANALAPFVDQATRELFALFDGHQVPLAVVEELVLRLVERRING